MSASASRWSAPSSASSSAARQGIGLLIATAQGAFNATGVFAAMIVLALVALAAEYLITLLENALIKWRPASLAETGF